MAWIYKVGMDPIQFGIVMMLNLGIGLITPPVGSTLFVGCSIGGARIEDIAKSLFPFYAIMFVVLMILTFVPEITTFIPNLIMGK